jgi:hypothetical protein
MIKVEIEIDNELTTYSFPTSWDDITISQYQRLYEIPKRESNDLFYYFDVLHALSNIEHKVLQQMSFSDFKQLTEQLQFIYTPVENKKLTAIDLEGDMYYIHTDFNKYTAGEIITIDTILRQYNHEYIKCMTDLLCVFLRKKDNDKVEIFTTDLLNRKELFSKIKIGDINNVFGFFLSGKNSLETNIKDSINENSPKKIVSLKES